MNKRSKSSDSAEFIKLLCQWFERNARDLPWRKNRSAYSTLVSEVLLQQTQSSRVVPAFKSFMRRFPSVRKLSKSDLQDVLTHWNGLGYYRRAQHLHSAANMIMTDFSGRVPQTVEDLQTLPGVGRYTAGAIASIVYRQPAPIVDGNVQRVLMRIYGKRGARNDKRNIEWTWNKATALVQQSKNPGQFNEAMMELGSTTCTPCSPHCDNCPVNKLCHARRLNAQHRIPGKPKRIDRKREHHHAVVYRRATNATVLLHRRPNKGMWSGLWQVPTVECRHRLTPAEIKKRLQIPARMMKHITSFKHITSHREITFHVYHTATKVRTGTWRTPDDISDLPMSNAQKRILKDCYSLIKR